MIGLSVTDNFLMADERSYSIAVPVWIIGMISLSDPIFKTAPRNIHFWVIWGARIKVLSKAIDPNVRGSLWEARKIVTANQFLPGMTPSMAGGEPVRIYLLNKDGLSIGDAKATVLGALSALQDDPNLVKAKNHLKEALRAGNYAKDLMRQVLLTHAHFKQTSTYLPHNIFGTNYYKKLCRWLLYCFIIFQKKRLMVPPSILPFSLDAHKGVTGLDHSFGLAVKISLNRQDNEHAKTFWH